MRDSTKANSISYEEFACGSVEVVGVISVSTSAAPFLQQSYRTSGVQYLNVCVMRIRSSVEERADPTDLKLKSFWVCRSVRADHAGAQSEGFGGLPHSMSHRPRRGVKPARTRLRSCCAAMPPVPHA